MNTNHRVSVLQSTLRAFQSPNNFRAVAFNNLESWKKPPTSQSVVVVEPNDWGDSTLYYTKKYGHLFTVLNMANPIYPGGGYKTGCIAQEENLWRRSDCSLYDANYHNYPFALHNQIVAKDSVVYCDVKNPRICIRSGEPSYNFLSPHFIFPFIEMRCAAINCNTTPFDMKETEKRISSQFNTLIKNNLKHVILGAFGCGAFNNPPEIIANIYKKQILQHQKHFSVIVFAIYNAGYGPDNYSVFKSIIPQTAAETFCDDLVV